MNVHFGRFQSGEGYVNEERAKNFDWAWSFDYKYTVLHKYSMFCIRIMACTGRKLQSEASMNEDWVTLNKAAKLLGVHPDTLRRWSDQGQIKVFRTPGGHRRFSESELSTFGRQRLRSQFETGLRDTMARRAIRRARREISSHQEEPWMQQMSEEQRNESRKLGRELLTLSVDYLVSDKNKSLLLQDAAQLGRDYGTHGFKSGLPLHQMLRAAIFFRDSLIETTLGMPVPQDGKDTARLLIPRVNEVMDVVQLEVVEAYQEKR